MGKNSGSRRVKTIIPPVNQPKKDVFTLIIIGLAVGAMIGMVLLMGLYQHDTEVRESYLKGQQDLIDNMYRSSGMCQGVKLNGRYGEVTWIPRTCCPN